MSLNKTQLDAVRKTGLLIGAFIKGAIFIAVALTAWAISLADQSTTFGEFVQVLQLPAFLKCVAWGGVVAALFRFFTAPPVMLMDWLEKIRSQRLTR